MLLLFSFIQSNLCALCWPVFFISLSTCSQLSSFRAEWHSRLWSEHWWGGRSLYPGAACQMSYWWHLSSCEMSEPQGSSSLIHYCQPTPSPVLFLSLFSFELYLLIVLSPVKGTKGPAPSLSPCAEIPHRNMLYSHVDEDDLSNDWQWESLKGEWIISEAWLFDSSFGQWIS